MRAGVHSDGSSLGGEVPGRADRRAGGPVTSAGVLSAPGRGGGRGRGRRDAAEHPRWGSRRIRLESLRCRCPGRTRPWRCPRVDDRPDPDPAWLLRQWPRKRPKESFKRFQRPAPMQLWGIDIVAGVQLVDTVTGELREAKLVTGIDDHSRFCVMATVVERATARAVCLAFAQALARYGVPEEVIRDIQAWYALKVPGLSGRRCEDRGSGTRASSLLD